MLLSRQTHTRSICRINWRLVARLSLPLTVLFWAVTLLLFYRWVLFQQTGRHRASLLWATQFLLKHGWHDLLKLAAAELAWSVGLSLGMASSWNSWVAARKRLEAVFAAPELDIKSGVWPPPPNVPE